jgi:hypothetical protein
MMDLTGILVPLMFWATVVLVVYFTAKYKYQTKKEMLARGGNIEFTKKPFPFLEIASTIVGLGIGLGVALTILLQSSDFVGSPKTLLILSFALFFSGIGMISGYFLKRHLDKK